MERTFRTRDLDRWVERGLISVEQRDAMLGDLQAGRQGALPTVDVQTLLYYGGGLLVLVAYSVFLSLQWEELNAAARIVVSSASIVFFAVVSHLLLRVESLRLPGELLQVVAVAVVPLLGFAVLDAAGLWPDDPGFRATRAEHIAYQSDVAWARMALAGMTLVAALGAFAISRSPFALVAVAASTVAFAVDATIQTETLESYNLDTTQTLTIAVLGALFLGAGMLSEGRTERDYTTWLYLMGLAGLAIGLGPETFPPEAAAGWGGLWMAVAVVVLALSVALQQRLFAAAGLAAIFAYLAKLVFDVFESAYAALVLVLLGLVVLGAGVLYQRYHERLFGPVRRE